MPHRRTCATCHCHNCCTSAAPTSSSACPRPPCVRKASSWPLWTSTWRSAWRRGWEPMAPSLSLAWQLTLCGRLCSSTVCTSTWKTRRANAAIGSSARANWRLSCAWRIASCEILGRSKRGQSTATGVSPRPAPQCHVARGSCTGRWMCQPTRKPSTAACYHDTDGSRLAVSLSPVPVRILPAVVQHCLTLRWLNRCERTWQRPRPLLRPPRKNLRLRRCASKRAANSVRSSQLQRPSLRAQTTRLSRNSRRSVPSLSP
mmetsp:Transcript_10577/g.24866  ORF Transcript_10577/g.24866 Transcript_10577/m.24866 type:complete len:259 (-) Transcript_10577:824-1600(-)